MLSALQGTPDDALRTVAEGINALRGPELGVLLITHYQRILDYIKPDVVHVLFDGRIVKAGGPELAGELEKKGYDWIIKQFAPANADVAPASAGVAPATAGSTAGGSA